MSGNVINPGASRDIQSSSASSTTQYSITALFGAPDELTDLRVTITGLNSGKTYRVKGLISLASCSPGAAQENYIFLYINDVYIEYHNLEGVGRYPSQLMGTYDITGVTSVTIKTKAATGSGTPFVIGYHNPKSFAIGEAIEVL